MAYQFKTISPHHKTSRAYRWHAIIALGNAQLIRPSCKQRELTWAAEQFRLHCETRTPARHWVDVNVDTPGSQQRQISKQMFLALAIRFNHWERQANFSSEPRRVYKLCKFSFFLVSHAATANLQSSPSSCSSLFRGLQWIICEDKCENIVGVSFNDEESFFLQIIIVCYQHSTRVGCFDAVECKFSYEQYFSSGGQLKGSLTHSRRLEE